MTSISILAKTLHTSEDVLKRVERAMEARFGAKKNVLEEIVAENASLIRERLSRLDIEVLRSDTVYDALLNKLKRDDQALFEYLNHSLCDTEEGCHELIATAQEIANIGRGFFLKEEKALELLRREPPQKILSFFGARSVDQLLGTYRLLDVYSALRFVEDKTWLNDVFFKQLEHVGPSDFEERHVHMHVLGQEWLHAAEKFLQKKYHNVSHLKELGIIFVIPLRIDSPGEAMRVFGLAVHYLHEVAFYSKLFKRFAMYERDQFARHFVSALRGDVIEKPFALEEQGKKWMIVQRYLAKEDPNDPRLFLPRVNPEAIHWTKAEDDIARLGVREKSLGLDFWHGLDAVGGYAPDKNGKEQFLSFNLIDTAMTLVSSLRNGNKYMYHHQEALWNKIFAAYVGIDTMEQMIVENFSKGYIEL